MKAFRNLLLIIGVAAIGLQCTHDPTATIKKLEAKMSADDFRFDDEGMKTANDLVQAYVDFAETHKQDAKAPVFLFSAGNLAMNLNQPNKALDLFNRIIYEYPDYEKTPDCLFLMGFIYENQLQNYSRAKEIYESFLQKYPDHEFADDAAMSIQNMGKPLEELVKEFEEKNSQQ